MSKGVIPLESQRDKRIMEVISGIANHRHMYYAYKVRNQGNIQLVTNMEASNAQGVMSSNRMLVARAIKRQLMSDGRLKSGSLCTVSHDETHDHVMQYWDDMSGNSWTKRRSRRQGLSKCSMSSHMTCIPRFQKRRHDESRAKDQ